MTRVLTDLELAIAQANISDSDYRYYAAEDRRHPFLASHIASPYYALRALAVICQHFRPDDPPVSLRFTSDKRFSYGWAGEHPGVLLCRGAPWLTLIHEVAHAFDYRDPPPHDQCHARMVDRIARFVEWNAWAQDDAAYQFQQQFGDAENLDE